MRHTTKTGWTTKHSSLVGLLSMGLGVLTLTPEPFDAIGAGIVGLLMPSFLIWLGRVLNGPPKESSALRLLREFAHADQMRRERMEDTSSDASEARSLRTNTIMKTSHTT